MKNIIEFQRQGENQSYIDGFNKALDYAIIVLQRPLKNLDLSEDYCDDRYIQKIRELKINQLKR